MIKLTMFSSYAKFLFPYFAFLAAAQSDPRIQPEPRPTMSDEEVAAIAEKAKSDPGILWELKDVPLEKTFLVLNELWSIGEGLSEQRENARKRGTEGEREWIDMQKQGRLDYETAEKVFPVAKEVLLTNPELEAFITAQLQRENDRLTTYYKNPGKPRKYEFVHPGLTHTTLLFKLHKIPGDGAFRMAGSFLSSPYFPPRNHGDYIEVSPASAARGTLAKLARERLWENIPEDIEGARKWWAENQHRFVGQPSGNAAAVTQPPINTSRPQPQQPQQPAQAATVAATTSPSRGNTWKYASLTALLIALGAAAWFCSRSART